MDTSLFVRMVENNAALIRAMLAEATDITRQPANVPNHPAWLLGHLTFARLGLAGVLGRPVERTPEMRETYGPRSTPVADPSKYPSKERLLADFEAAQAHVVAGLRAATPALLASPNPIELLKAACPTVGDVVVRMVALHDGLHIGQLAVWRRAVGLAPIIA